MEAKLHSIHAFYEYYYLYNSELWKFFQLKGNFSTRNLIQQTDLLNIKFNMFFGMKFVRRISVIRIHMKTRTLILLFGMVVILASCKKDREMQEPANPSKMEELSVPSSFTWKTTKDFSLTLSANADGIAEVNNTSGISYQKAYLSPGQAYTMKLTVPAYEKAVKLKFLGQESELQLSATTLSYQFQ